MAQKSKKGRGSKRMAKRDAVAKALRSTKNIARGTKARAAKAARSRSIKSVPRAAPVRFVPGGPNDNLDKIDHIVVLMMENRSFDHMLGYLKLEGSNPEINGLEAGMSNTHGNHAYPIHHLTTTVFEHDPGHQGDAVAAQLSNNNSGFVDNYASIHRNDEPGLIMGYHNASAVPVYDHLVRHFCVCDSWFCSVPGATWPNRLYATTGQSPSKDNKRVPIFDLPSFVRHLDAANVSWRGYAHDMATLRLIDCRFLVCRCSNLRKEGLPEGQP